VRTILPGRAWGSPEAWIELAVRASASSGAAGRIGSRRVAEDHTERRWLSRQGAAWKAEIPSAPVTLARSLFRLALGARLPKIDGTLCLDGLRAPVTVRRDAYGIPCIEATCDDDAWLALGFCQGQDRAFQIESLIRVVHGRLAEVAGPDALPMDRLSRRIGFARLGQARIPFMPEATQRQMASFARGVTLGARLGCEGKAHELTLLGIEPTPFEAADVLGVSLFIAFALASNWDVELARLRILREDGPEALAALDPAYPASLPVSSPPGAPAGPSIDRLTADLAAFQRFAGAGGASNAWVVAPSRSATGRPLLANDPHLPPALPVSWYLAHMRTPGWAIAGACFVSQPGFSAGHNGFAAWGVTAGHHDNTDLFLEEMGPDGRSVRQGDRFVPCEVRREVIRVKGASDVVEEVVVTPRGPIVGPAFRGEVGAISLAATWAMTRPTRASYEFHHVRSFADFRALYASAPCLSTSFVYADTDGHIGWMLVGDAPVRRSGHGLVPAPGWDPEAGWEPDPVPAAAMPHAFDPEAGFLSHANSQPIAGADEPYLGTDWLDGYRQARITEALAARSDWTVPAFMTLQLDQTSLPWREIRSVVLALPVLSADARLALDLLASWDGLVSAGSPGAAVFELFLAEMVRRTVRAKAPKSAHWAMGEGTNLVLPHSLFALRRTSHLTRLIRDQPAGWFLRSWPDEMVSALERVVHMLRRTRGPSPSAWAWGEIRPLHLRHLVGSVRPFDAVFNRGPFPCGGDATTIPQASVSWLHPTSDPIGIASMRLVIDVGCWDESRVALAGGQSGNPLSPHYDDQIAWWQRGEGVPLPWSREAVEQATRSVLRLLPKGG
jgi:penicillin amidase